MIGYANFNEYPACEREIEREKEIMWKPRLSILGSSTIKYRNIPKEPFSILLIEYFEKLTVKIN